jgi:hypothetical protein
MLLQIQEFSRKMSLLVLGSIKSFSTETWHLVLLFIFVLTSVLCTTGCLSLPANVKPPRTVFTWSTRSQAFTTLGRNPVFYKSPEFILPKVSLIRSSRKTDQRNAGLLLLYTTTTPTDASYQWTFLHASATTVSRASKPGHCFVPQPAQSQDFPSCLRQDCPSTSKPGLSLVFNQVTTTSLSLFDLYLISISIRYLFDLYLYSISIRSLFDLYVYSISIRSLSLFDLYSISIRSLYSISIRSLYSISI